MAPTDPRPTECGSARNESGVFPRPVSSKKPEAKPRVPCRKFEVIMFGPEDNPNIAVQILRPVMTPEGPRHRSTGDSIDFNRNFSGWKMFTISKAKVYIPAGRLEDKLAAVMFPTLALCEPKKS